MKKRVDILLVDRGLAESRSQAQRLCMAGDVLANGQVVYKPGTEVLMDTELILKQKPPFVSRGGEKLEAALKAFGLIDLRDKVCVDIGASTGGFVDCLLQHHAARIYAVDVGYGQLHEKLRQDTRVVNMERTNARTIEGFPEAIDLVTIDASFISLTILLPVVKSWHMHGMLQVVALVKPQFEVGREIAARGRGVVKDENIREQVVKEILEFAETEGYTTLGVIDSPLLGPKGNKEFLIYLEVGRQTSV